MDVTSILCGTVVFEIVDLKAVLSILCGTVVFEIVDLKAVFHT
jgi:hypothetical protein